MDGFAWIRESTAHAVPRTAHGVGRLIGQRILAKEGRQVLSGFATRLGLRTGGMHRRRDGGKRNGFEERLGAWGAVLVGLRTRMRMLTNHVFPPDDVGHEPVVTLRHIRDGSDDF